MGIGSPPFLPVLLWFSQESFIEFKPDKDHFVLTRIEFVFGVSFLSGFRFFYNCIRKDLGKSTESPKMDICVIVGLEF